MQVIERTNGSRFIETINADGSKTIIDKYNNYKIIYTDSQGYVAYDKFDNEVYHIYPDGQASFKLKDGTNFVTGKTMSIEDMKPTMDIKVDDLTYTISNREITKAIKYYPSGDYSIRHYYDKNHFYEETTYGITYYTRNDKTYKITYPSGDIRLVCDDTDIIMLSDGRYYSNNNDAGGTYELDANNNYVLKNNDGSVTFLDGFGKKVKYIDSGSKRFEYNDQRKSQKVVKNGKVSYAMINHIEYDEETYNEILTTLNDIGDSCEGTVRSTCSDIESTVSSFPDGYSSDAVSSISSDIKDHFGLISSLSEMTNYSLLAYQTCDENLRDVLYSLIDSLFDKGNNVLAEKFKSIIKTDIENKDGILEYKMNTNFSKNSFLANLLVNHPDAIILEGDELKKFISDNHVQPLDSLIVTKETNNINGVDFNVYRAVDVNTLDSGFNKYVDASNRVISKVDKNILKYVKNTGTHLIYYSDYTVDSSLYDSQGQYIGSGSYNGFANPDTFGIVAVYHGKSSAQNDCESILHELGHNLDNCIYYNQTNNHGTTTIPNYDYYNLPGSTRELAHEEYYAYDTNYQYKDDYSNSETYQPSEFIAESFKNYYTTDINKREKYAQLLPKTFDFLKKLEVWTSKQNNDTIVA